MNQSTGKRPLLLLTGASGLFGRTFIELFHEKYDIVGLYHNTPVPGVAGQSEIFDVKNKKHRHFLIRAIRCDLNDINAVHQTIRSVCRLCGTPSVLVNAAADVSFLGSTLNYRDHFDEANTQLALNTSIPACLASLIFHECWKHVRPNDQNASIMNVSSISGMKFYKGTEQAVYAASKAALNMMTLYMASEYMPYKIRVNGIAPDRFEAGSSAEKVVRFAEEILSGSKTGQVKSI